MTTAADGSHRETGGRSVKPVEKGEKLSEPAKTRVAVIAAAGRGRRFQGQGPKVLADVEGRPCLRRVLDAVEGGLDEHLQLIVVGHEADAIRDVIGEAPYRRYVYQREPRGTGHALREAVDTLAPGLDGHLYFFCGDKPLLQADTVGRFRDRFERTPPGMLFLTGLIDGESAQVRESKQGRVVWVDQGGASHALGIVERKVIEAIGDQERLWLYNGKKYSFTREQLLDIRDVNVSTYAWSIPELRRHIAELSDDNAQGEYLVTDLVQIFIRHGLSVQTLPLTDPREGRGIDTVEQLLEITR